MIDIKALLPELNSQQLRALHRIILEDVVGENPVFYAPADGKLTYEFGWIIGNMSAKGESRRALDDLFNIDRKDV